MTATALIALSASLALFSLLTSAFVLFVVWKRPEQHPDVARLDAELLSLRQSVVDVVDQVEHWIKRSSVRQAREKREGGGEVVQVQPSSPAERKRALQRQVFGG